MPMMASDITDLTAGDPLLVLCPARSQPLVVRTPSWWQGGSPCQLVPPDARCAACCALLVIQAIPIQCALTSCCPRPPHGSLSGRYCHDRSFGSHLSVVGRAHAGGR